MGTKFRNFSDGDNFYFRDNDNTSVFIINDATGATLVGTLTETSDVRTKSNVQTISSALSKVVRMRGVSYASLLKKGGSSNVGLIAQELEAIAPELVRTGSNSDETVRLKDNTELTNLKSISYGNLVPYLIEAIKELKVEVDALGA